MDTPGEPTEEPTVDGLDGWPILDERRVFLSGEALPPRHLDQPSMPASGRFGNRFALGLLLGLLLAILVAGALAAGWLVMREQESARAAQGGHTRPPLIVMPRLVGIHDNKALERLRRLGLRASRLSRATRESTGTVVAQKPGPGETLTAGRTVVLVVDQGSPRIRVPDLRGLAASRATARLERLGLRVKMTRVDSTRPSETVVAQTPTAGQALSRGTLVVLSVATAATIEVPQVAGNSAPVGIRMLRSAGLRVAVATISSTEPSGMVVWQQPAAGAQVTRETTVRLSVSNGTTSPATTTTETNATPRRAPLPVPDLSSEPLQQAAQQLAPSGLLLSIQYIPGQEPLGTVLAQSPAAGTTTTPRSHVTLNLSSGPGDKPTTAVPNLEGQTLAEAVTRSQAAGLRIIYLKYWVSDRTQAGEIVEQTPRAGARAPKNAQLLVYLAAYRVHQ
jgi:beta-lactam-binding protein with PASTA domain